jgi:antitoxin PrlF
MDGSSQNSRMATRITNTGHVTIPRRVREALRLAPGDALEFHVNVNGEVVMRKAVLAPATAGRRARRVNPNTDAQMRRRAAELLALLRGLD